MLQMSPLLEVCESVKDSTASPLTFECKITLPNEQGVARKCTGHAAPVAKQMCHSRARDDRVAF